jgi:hypothetical protein
MVVDKRLTGPKAATTIPHDAGSPYAQRLETSSLRTGLLWLLMTATVMAACGDRAEAQALAVAPGPALRIEWTVDPARSKWRAVCGYIYNDTPIAPREVRLLVEARDASERVIDSRIVRVLGYIAPGGRTYFCSTATAAAARYSVTIIGVQGSGDR